MSESCGSFLADKPLPYEQALALVREHVAALPSEVVAIADALGSFLAEPARARSHSPRFEQSAMDGYAVRLADLATATAKRPVALQLGGMMPAGGALRLRLKPGQTVRVFTGSPLPGGTEAVVVQEQTVANDGTILFARQPRAGDHIRRVGDEYRRGEEILPAGACVTPPVVGMLAQLGRSSVRVGRRPRVLVITMGDELVPAGEKPGRAQIPDANGPALCAALRAMGIPSPKHVRVADNAADLRRVMLRGLRLYDLIVTAGGASVGDHDHVPQVRAELGITDLYARVAIRPGLPNWFGLAPGRVPVFGLPGNPVSAMVSFHQLVRPAVLRMMGAQQTDRPWIPVRLAQEARPASGRLTWVRARIVMGGDGTPEAVPDRGQGSHMLSGLARADVLVEIAAGETSTPAGALVPVRSLDWFER